MNRTSVIILCVTTLIIFFMLKEKPKLDIQKYEDEIKSLQTEIDQLDKANDSLIIKAIVLNDKLVEYDNTINKLNRKIDVIQVETKKKLDSVDRYNRDQLQKFFTERYRAVDSPTN